jgi:DNA polymerase-3 subunit gamma/tau
MDKSNVLALKYRPTKLSSVVGQENVTTTLTNAFLNEDLYQCFIFGGNFGCGKTTTARILAAMENCQAHKGPTLEPCGECQMCRDIFSGQSSDVKEINAASANGIDDIRNIVEFVSVRPLLARVKYVILDECHMLSIAAREATLKILEEPPEGVRFVLCTTDAHKLKGTIHSRAMPFRFNKVAWPQILEHLRVIASCEGIKADEAALKVCARLSDGSVRNSLRNLQLLITYAGKNPITAEIAQQALGVVSEDNFFELTDSILAKDATSAIKSIQLMVGKGQGIEQIMAGLTEHLRNLMVLTSCQNTSGILFLSEDEKKRYVHQIKRMSIHLVTDMITLLYDVQKGAAVNMNPQLLLEQFVLKAMFAVAKLERLAKQQT